MVAGIQIGSPAELPLRAVGVALALKREAQMVVGRGVVLCELDRRPELGDGAFEIT